METDQERERETKLERKRERETETRLAEMFYGSLSIFTAVKIFSTSK